MASLSSVLIVVSSSAWAEGINLPQAEPEEVGMSSERLERIGVAMDRYIDDDLVPGTVTLVSRNGKVVHLDARGKRDVGKSVV